MGAISAQPLSHINTKTTFECYAVKGADNVYEARNRCVEKYGSNASPG